MNENRRRARTALFSLKEAVLDVYSKHERDTRVLSIPTTLENVLAYPERTNQIPGVTQLSLAFFSIFRPTNTFGITQIVDGKLPSTQHHY